MWATDHLNFFHFPASIFQFFHAPFHQIYNRIKSPILNQVTALSNCPIILSSIIVSSNWSKAVSKACPIPLSKHTWKLKIIVIWNTEDRVCLNAHNKNWLKEVAKEIPEAKCEIQNIHNHPYLTALGSGQHSGLNKLNKLPNDHPQASEGPDKTIALISTDQILILMKHPKTDPAKT